MIVLLGLIECKGRRMLRGLRNEVGEKVSLYSLSRFFSRWQWPVSTVAETWLGRFREQMKACVQAEHHRQHSQRDKRRGRPQAIMVTGYLIVDASIHLKSKVKLRIHSVAREFQSHITTLRLSSHETPHRDIKVRAERHGVVWSAAAAS